MSGAPAAGATCEFSGVSVDQVSRAYGRRRALWRVSVECRAGAILGLFGPNGAGKSTLLGVLSTLVQPTAGIIRYGTQTSTEWGDRLRSRIGVHGPELFLYADLTARENLEFFARLYRVPDVGGAVTKALEAARLTDRAGDRAGSFSRGLRQRLALERALVHTPRLVLLDEPFTGLDDASAALLVDRLRQLRASGAIVVMATHDFDLADGCVDEAVCLANGKLVPMASEGGSLRQRYRDAVEAAQA